MWPLVTTVQLMWPNVMTEFFYNWPAVITDFMQLLAWDGQMSQLQQNTFELILIATATTVRLEWPNVTQGETV